MGFLTEVGQRELKSAIGDVEAVSSVELVISVRHRLRRWPSANAAVGVVCALLALGFQLYSESLEFDYWAILALPVVAGLVGGLLVEFMPGLQRALTPARIRSENLLEAARATFYELGVHKTAGRTGLLVFIAIRDRSATLVGDVAVVEKVGEHRLDEIGAKLATAIPQGTDACARVLREATAALGKALPKAGNDVDELANAVHVQLRGKKFVR